MKKNVNYSFLELIYKRKRLFISLGGLGYSLFLISITAIEVRNGIIGHFLKPLIETNIKTPINSLKSKFAENKNLVIDLNQKEIIKISSKRNEAKRLGQLFINNNDWSNANISTDNESAAVKIRLKGQYSDHWGHDKWWSYKVNVKNGKTILGMKRFAIQHPKTRNYMNEWYFHKMMRYAGIISPRYFFIQLKINGNPYPIYAVEENFEKRLIENNNKREGVIFMLSSREMTQERQTEDLSFYQYKRYKADEKSSILMRRAERLISGFLSGELKAKEVFDIKLMSKAFAICDLFGNHHSLYRANIRYYLNPVTGLIEPIPFDNQFIKDVSIKGLIGEFSKQNGTSIDDVNLVGGGRNFTLINSKLLNDIDFSYAYGKALNEISDKKWLDQFFSSIQDEEKKATLILHKSYPWYTFKYKPTLYQNQSYIRSVINPNFALRSFLRMPDNSNKIKIRVANYHTLPIEIKSLISNDGKLLYKLEKPIFISNKPRLCLDGECTSVLRNKTIYNNFNINTNAIDNKLVKNLNLNVGVVGTNYNFTQPLFSIEESKNILPDTYELSKLKFIELNNKSRTINIKKGEWLIRNDLVIPEGYNFRIDGGTILNLTNSSNIISYSPINFSGSKDLPIIIDSKDSSGGGVSIISANSISKINFTTFRNLGSLKSDGLSYTGSVTFYESDVEINSSKFENNRSEDALNLIRSKHKLTDNIFYNSFSDAIDIDFSNGIIKKTILSNIGNDAIDVSGAESLIEDIKVLNSGDKGISVGEKSNVFLKNIYIDNAIIGIASKDKSRINGSKISISNSNVGLASYQKKPEFGPSYINLKEISIKDTKESYLLEDFSSIILDGEKVKSNAINLFNRLYGED